MKRIIVFTVLLLILSGCQIESFPDNGKINVVTTVYPVYNIVEYIGGEYVNVVDIYPPGSDSHTYQLTSNDIRTIADSDLFFYTSDTLEHWASDLANSAEYETEFINITEDPLFKDNADPSLYGESEHSHHAEDEETSHDSIIDPHIWMSPKLLYLMNDVITYHLCLADTEHCPEFTSRSQIVDQQIDIIDQEMLDFASTNQKTIIVAHDAYNYWTIDYGIPIFGLYGASEDDEPSAKVISTAIELIYTEDINTIYFEQNDLHNKAIMQVADQTGVQTNTLNNLETVSSSDFENKTSFIELYERNITALKEI